MDVSFRKSMDKILKSNDIENINGWSIKSFQFTTGIRNKRKIEKIIKFTDNILSNMVESSDEYHHGTVTYYKYKGKTYFEINNRYYGPSSCCCSYKFWEKFEKFEINDIEIRKSLKYMLEIHLKRKVPMITRSLTK